MDQLMISDLEVWTHIGVTEEERGGEQRLLVSMDLALDTRETAKNDDLKKSIDYASVAEAIRDLSKAERKTIERFAEDAAAMILKKFHPERVTVTVKKYAVPGSAFVSMTIERP